MIITLMVTVTVTGPFAVTTIRAVLFRTTLTMLLLVKTGVTAGDVSPPPWDEPIDEWVLNI